MKFIFVEIPKFVKKEDELKNNIDKWLFVLKNLSQLKRLPSALKTEVFVRLFQLAKVAELSKTEYMRYEKNLMEKWDQHALLESAVEKGREEGREEEKQSFIRNLLLSGDFTIERIAALAGVSQAYVQKLEKIL